MMNEIWKREIDKVYMSEVVCLDKDTVEKIEDGHRMGAIFSRNPSEGSVLFYKKREWVGLTDQERIDILVDATGNKWDDRKIIEAIEAKLKEKNSA
jgi:hypothetical protein